MNLTLNEQMKALQNSSCPKVQALLSTLESLQADFDLEYFGKQDFTDFAGEFLGVNLTLYYGKTGTLKSAYATNI